MEKHTGKPSLSCSTAVFHPDAGIVHGVQLKSGPLTKP